MAPLGTLHYYCMHHQSAAHLDEGGHAEGLWQAHGVEVGWDGRSHATCCRSDEFHDWAHFGDVVRVHCQQDGRECDERQIQPLVRREMQLPPPGPSLPRRNNNNRG